jgi:hypothetical protein
MKTRFNLFLGAGLLIATSAMFATILLAAETPKAAPGEGNIPKSVFTVPVRGGPVCTDPFFPKTDVLTRKPDGRGPTLVQPKTTVDIDYIVFSGTPESRLATITVNGVGRTFKVGESTEVSSRGALLHVRCIEITEEKVVVEVNGESRTVPFRSR